MPESPRYLIAPKGVKSMAYEYRVLKDYEDSHWGFYLVEGDIVTDADFPEPDIPSNLVGKNVLEPADMEAEGARLADATEQE